MDWKNLHKRLSTWAALVSAAATSGLWVYGAMPVEAKEAFPEWGLLALGVLAVGAALLVPAATSAKQKSLRPSA